MEEDQKIIQFQKLYLKHYGKAVDYKEAEKLLQSLVGLLETVRDSSEN